ncbi:MAG: hypothetical protein CR986_09860, partial [Ignavibacteriae bacterium]
GGGGSFVLQPLTIINSIKSVSNSFFIFVISFIFHFFSFFGIIFCKLFYSSYNLLIYFYFIKPCVSLS